jgi:GC-rich sequence DNA-binding factor
MLAHVVDQKQEAGFPVSASEQASAAGIVKEETEAAASNEESKTGPASAAAKPARLLARQKRRAAAKARVEVEKVEEGWSTDDDLCAELDVEFTRQRGEVLLRADELFKDVNDDFRTLDKIKSRMEAWKYKHTQAYMDAYIALSVPALFSPYVRLQLLVASPPLTHHAPFCPT